MALIIDESFTAGIPAGFATIANDAGTLTATYNSAQQAVDLVKGNYNSAWILNTFTTPSAEVEVEVDMEFLGGAAPYFGVYFSPNPSSPNYSACLYFSCSPTATGIGTFFTGTNRWGWTIDGDSTTGTLSHISTGTRKTYTFRTKVQDGYRYFEILANGSRLGIYYLNNPTLTSSQFLRPSLFIRNGTFRVHSIRAWDQLSTSSPFPRVEGKVRGLKDVIGVMRLGSQGLSSKPNTRLLDVRISRKNIYYGGAKSISGVVTVNGIPAQRKVRLHAKSNGVVVQETWSKKDGSYTFSDLDESREYYVVSFDHPEVYNMVGKDRIRFESDPLFSKVVLLLHGESLSDSSGKQNAIAPLGPTPPTIATQGVKLGASGIFFNGGYLGLPDNSRFAFLTNDFTIEFFAKPTDISQPFHIIYDSRDLKGLGGLVIYTNSAGQARVFTNPEMSNSPDGSTEIYSAPGALQVGVWTHIAVVRTQTSINLYINGVCSTNMSKSTGPVNFISYSSVMIGKDAINNYYKGYIDEFRITNGAARYTQDFTPPTKEFLNM